MVKASSNNALALSQLGSCRQHQLTGLPPSLRTYGNRLLVPSLKPCRNQATSTHLTSTCHVLPGDHLGFEELGVCLLSGKKKQSDIFWLLQKNDYFRFHRCRGWGESVMWQWRPFTAWRSPSLPLARPFFYPLSSSASFHSKPRRAGTCSVRARRSHGSQGPEVFRAEGPL